MIALRLAYLFVQYPYSGTPADIEIDNRHGALLIFDEVMCGVGRTGTFFAFEQEGVVPDIMTIGKGLGGGYAPIAAVLASNKVVDVLRKGTAMFNHGHTYQAHVGVRPSTILV